MWRRVHPRDWRRVTERAEGRTDGWTDGRRRREGVWYLRQAGAAGLPLRVCPGGVVCVDRFVLAGRHAHCWGGWRSGEEGRCVGREMREEEKDELTVQGILRHTDKHLKVHSVPQKRHRTQKTTRNYTPNYLYQQCLLARDLCSGW